MPTITQFPMTRQGLQDIALVLIAGMVIFGVLAFVSRQRGNDPRRQLVSVGILGSLIGIHWSLALSAMVLLAITAGLLAFTLRGAR